MHPGIIALTILLGLTLVAFLIYKNKSDRKEMDEEMEREANVHNKQHQNNEA